MTIGVLVTRYLLVLSTALSLGLPSTFALAQTHLRGELLYNFDPTAPNGVNATGANPNGGLVADAQGRLYGVTYNGGTFGQGTIYRLTRPASGTGSWTEEVLYSFENDDYGPKYNGENPTDGLAIDQAGIVYGTTEFGGEYGVGIVFGFDPSTSTFTILHNFRYETNDGMEPLIPRLPDQNLCAHSRSPMDMMRHG